jgi:hypothetical protein
MTVDRIFGLPRRHWPSRNDRANRLGRKDVAQVVHHAGKVDDLHRDMCQRDYNEQIGGWCNSYGGTAVDAALLLMLEVSFLPATLGASARPWPRWSAGSYGAASRTATRPDRETVDGLPGTEGVSRHDPSGSWTLTCSWGRRREARELFERLPS